MRILRLQIITISKKLIIIVGTTKNKTQITNLLIWLIITITTKIKMVIIITIMKKIKRHFKQAEVRSTLNKKKINHFNKIIITMIIPKKRICKTLSNNSNNNNSSNY